ncbi:Uncharacterised protein [Mycobacteroides abscessus subsp. abscessus]|nr:Uncharacterised protein [Mycobacteroides abscessus subsp. abscessus]SKW18411.1 Uncharacterised protein [Mycobacteroides abscessus subsp. abscessus]
MSTNRYRSAATRIKATRNAGGSVRSQTAARSAAHSRWSSSSLSAQFHSALRST